MSRQTERQEARAEAKEAASALKWQRRKTLRRELLERQTRREKAGFYNGIGAAALVTPSRSRVSKRRVKKGKPFGRILETGLIGGREWQRHATKGYRSYKA